MVKLINVEKREADGKGIVTLFADSKEDVTSDMSIHGLAYGLTPSMGSVLYTANGEIANLDSEGNWVWVGDEEEDSRSVSNSLRTTVIPTVSTVEEKDISDSEETGDER